MFIAHNNICLRTLYVLVTLILCYAKSCYCYLIYNYHSSINKLLVSLTRIVRSYLLHYGYEETLNSFDMASKTTVPPVYIAQENGFDEQDILYALNERKTLRKVWNFRLTVCPYGLLVDKLVIESIWVQYSLSLIICDRYMRISLTFWLYI